MRGQHSGGKGNSISQQAGGRGSSSFASSSNGENANVSTIRGVLERERRNQIGTGCGNAATAYTTAVTLPNFEPPGDAASMAKMGGCSVGNMNNVDETATMAREESPSGAVKWLGFVCALFSRFSRTSSAASSVPYFRDVDEFGEGERG